MKLIFYHNRWKELSLYQSTSERRLYLHGYQQCFPRDPMEYLTLAKI